MQTIYDNEIRYIKKYIRIIYYNQPDNEFNVNDLYLKTFVENYGPHPLTKTVIIY